MANKHGFGCLLSPIDLRDYRLRNSKVSATELPESFDLNYNHNVKSQGSVSSCAAHAGAEVIEYYNPGHKMSTNFIYGIRRLLFGSIGKGMYLRDVCKILSKYGDMTELDCKGNTEIDAVYEIAEKAFNDKDKLDRAYKFKIKEYVKLNSINDIKFFIMNHGPVLASIKWYDSYKCNKSTGILERKDPENNDYTNHAVVIYGWDNDYWMCQNSWGISWGNRGLFRIKFADKLNESYGLIDDTDLNDDSDVVDPTYNFSLLEKIFKIINAIIVMIKKH